MSWGVSPWFYPVWDSLGFLDLDDYVLPLFREVFNYYLLNIVVFNIVLEVSEIVLIFLNLFFFFPLLFIYFYHSIF